MKKHVAAVCLVDRDEATEAVELPEELRPQLGARWPDAAASLREGLEDMFTVRRLGVGGRLKGYRQIPTLVAALARHVKLLHRHAMLHQSHERTSGRPAAQWCDSKLDALTTSAPSLERSPHEDTPDRVAGGVGSCAPAAAGEGKGADPRP